MVAAAANVVVVVVVVINSVFIRLYVKIIQRFARVICYIASTLETCCQIFSRVCAAPLILHGAVHLRNFSILVDAVCVLRGKSTL